MHELFVVFVDNETRAEEIRADLTGNGRGDLIDIKDYAIVTMTKDRRIKLERGERPGVGCMMNNTAYSGFWGWLVIDLLVFNPLVSLNKRNNIPSISSPLSGIGIKDDFIEEVVRRLRPGVSALFLLVKAVGADHIPQALRKYKEKILQSSLSTPYEERLQTILTA